MAARIFLACMLVVAASAVIGERFDPDAAGRTAMTIQGKERVFYRYQNGQYLFTPLADLAALDANYLRRNPLVCCKGKIVAVQDGSIELFGTKDRFDLAANAPKYVKGDNVWIFAEAHVRADGRSAYYIVDQVFEIESDEELFFKWRKSVPPNDPAAFIELGLRAIKEGRESGNAEVWARLGRSAIMEGLDLKRTRMSTPAEYITLAEEILKLLGDRGLAAGIAAEAWKKNRENTDLNNYLKNVLRYSLYKNEWIPSGERYEREFWDKFNAIGYTEDQQAWDLKRWVELNAEKLRDSEEKIMLCATRAYEINPARPDAAVFLGKPVMDIQGLTSGVGVTIPRKLLVIAIGERSRVDFTVDNSWAMDDVAGMDMILARLRAGDAGDVTVTVRTVPPSANIEEVKSAFLLTVRELKGFRDLGAEVIALNGTDVYRVIFEFAVEAQIVRNEALLVNVAGDYQDVALVFQAPAAVYDEYAEEFTRIRTSLRLTE
ncbi:MAG: hypothetical protein ABIF71_00650 [Planctomycetota bacterium]